MLRSIIRDQGRWDLDRLEERIRENLREEEQDEESRMTISASSSLLLHHSFGF